MNKLKENLALDVCGVYRCIYKYAMCMFEIELQATIYKHRIYSHKQDDGL